MASGQRRDMVANLKARALFGNGHEAVVIGVAESILGELVVGNEMKECLVMGPRLSAVQRYGIQPF